MLCLTYPNDMERDLVEPKTEARRVPRLLLIGGSRTGSVFDYDLVTGPITGSNEVPVVVNVDRRSAPRTAAENLKRAQEVFKPSMSELAKIFGVSRQTLYNWLDGDRPRFDQMRKLEALAGYADIIAGADLSNSSRLLSRKITGEQSLLDVLMAGEDTKEFVNRLVNAAEREDRDRRNLNERFRTRRGRTDLSEFATSSEE